MVPREGPRNASQSPGIHIWKLSCGSVYMQEIWGESVGVWDVYVSIATIKDASIMILVIRLTFTGFFCKVPSPRYLERNDTDHETKSSFEKATGMNDETY